MGRYYWDKKKTVEECLTLTTKYLKGPLTKAMEIGHRGLIGSGVLSWGKSKIGYEIERQSVCYTRLKYVSPNVFTGQKTNLDYRVQMTHTTPHYGGYRWWFICPLKGCGRRVAKLYKPPLAAYFGCRHCYNLTYQSTRENGVMDKADRRLRAIYKRLGGTGNYHLDLPKKPSTMRNDTYFRLLREYMNLLYIRDVALDQRLTSMFSLLEESRENMLREDSRDLWRRYKGDPYTPLDREEEGFEDDFEEEEEEGFEDDFEEEEEDDFEDGFEVEGIDWEAIEYGTLGEIARDAAVSYEFAKEAQAHDLIRPDKGRGKRKKRYRRKLATWLEKLHLLNQAGYSWDDLKAWTKRRFKKGHEHEARYPAGFKELAQ